MPLSHPSLTLHDAALVFESDGPVETSTHRVVPRGRVILHAHARKPTASGRVGRGRVGVRVCAILSLSRSLALALALALSLSLSLSHSLSLSLCVCVYMSMYVQGTCE